jgi:hypothetical protein
MLNRRTFFKTTAAALPMTSALDMLEPEFALSAETVATAFVSGDTPNLIPLPQRRLTWPARPGSGRFAASARAT